MTDIVERLRGAWEKLPNDKWLLNAADEVERLRKAAAPLCIGPPLISILAKDGAWLSSDGQAVIAADDLRGNDPYAEIERLRHELWELKAIEKFNTNEVLTAEVERLRAEIEHLQSINDELCNDLAASVDSKR
jgi:hypothetical protein